MMKNYLNAKDMNDLLFLSHLLEVNTNMLQEWKEYGNLTKDEARALKTAITWTEKFLKGVLGRLPNKEVDKFMKRTIKAQKEPVRILDKWMKDRILGSYETEYEIVKTERPQFEKLAFACIEAHCEDCTSPYCECDIYDIFEDNLMPRAELLKNCPYAYWSEETIEKMRIAQEKRKAEEEEKKQQKKLGSKRSRKKKANRFDEDEEIYEYKLAEKGEK